jgi:branched-chain amino acid transport system ATP-binding protein
VGGGGGHGSMGANGAGKTTLFNIINGMLFADSGTIRFDGKDITTLALERRAKLGLSRSFQRNSCFLDMSVAENLAVAIILADGFEWHVLRSMRTYSSVQEKIETVAASVGLRDSLNTPAHMLSYGTQRQLEVGLALAARPRLLLLDEPTAGMSPEETRNIQTLIKSLPRSLTIVIIEHDMDVVLSVADRVTVLDAGTILMQGTPDDVRASAAVRARYLGDPQA